jgi:hypothetical protein
VLKAVWALAWARFKIIAAIIGDIQGRVISTLFYFTILVPFSLIARVATDPLHVRDRKPAWLERAAISDSLEDARRQG